MFTEWVIDYYYLDVTGKYTILLNIYVLYRSMSSNLLVDPGKRTYLVLDKILKEVVISTEMSHGCP